MITFKYRLYPNQEQQKLLWSHANKLNWLYNQFLDLKIEAYKKDKTTYNLTQLDALIPGLCQQDPILASIHSQVRQQVTKRLDKAYNAFFKLNNKFPKFRSCRNFFGICYPQNGYSIMGNVLHTKVYGDIKFKLHRLIQGTIKQMYITTKNNKWYVCLTTEVIRTQKYYNPSIDLHTAVGIDIGTSTLVAVSDNTIIKNRKDYKYFDNKISEVQSKRDKLKDKFPKGKKYSRQTNHLSKVIRKLYIAKNNKVKDFQHKVTNYLSRTYNTIFIENLLLKQMGEGKISGLNKELRNANIGQFINLLKYKCNHVFEVNPAYTSQICYNCNNIVKMPLHKRTYICSCGYVANRDINAARNILKLGMLISDTGNTKLSLKDALLV